MEDPLSSIEPKLFHSLMRIYGSSTEYLFRKLFTPPNRLYIRVNTLLISRDELIDLLKEKGLNPNPDPYIEDAIYFNVKGPYHIPILDKRIIVDRYTAESLMLGANLYRPGVIKYDDFNKGEKVNVVAPNNMIVAVVKTVVSSDKLKYMKKGLIGYNILSKYRAPALRSLEEYNKGYFYSQSLPAMMVSRVIKPKPYELIADLTAAPGGKTSHVVQLTKGLARVVAFERNVKKTLKLINNLKILKLYRNVIALPMDSRYIDIDLDLVGRVDKVIVDPPCSSLGVRPRILIDRKYEDIIVLRDYQIQFLRVASKIVRPGGLIVYSTCTLTFEENELNVLEASKWGLKPIDLGELPYSERVLFDEVIAYRYSPLYYDMPGYFIALLKKTVSS
ncbi:MAG: RNA methyltransferase [Desulfurococcales archaeon ex4484_58]|nr:MAG: RNA methyltransferase [Desulfurococcales archaeon ex4484_58]